MSQKSIKKNYIYNLCYQILIIITPLITTPYVSRVLGAYGIGTVGYAESIVSYFILFATFGISTYGQREISYAQESAEKRSMVFWNTKLLGLCTSGVALLVYFLFAVTQGNHLLYFILSVHLLAVAADITWFFQGLEEFGKIVVRNIIINVLNVAYILLAIKIPEHFYRYAFGHAFFQLLSNASLWLMLPRYLTKVKFRDLHPFRDVKVVLSLFVPTIAVQVYTVLDKTMIGAITQDFAENGYYDQAIKISKMVLTVVTALGTVMVPRIGYYFEKKEHEEVKRLMFSAYRFVWFLGIPLCFGLISVSSNFVPWFFGAGYEKVISLLNVLSFLILAIGINNVTGMQYLIPTKRQNIFTQSVIIGAVGNFVLNIALIPLMKSIGAAIASVVAETIIAVVQLLLVRNEISPLRVLKEGTHYFIAGCIMAGGVLYLGTYLSPSIVNTMILAICGALIYFTVLILLKDEFFFSNVRKIFNTLVKRVS